MSSSLQYRKPRSLSSRTGIAGTAPVKNEGAARAVHELMRDHLAPLAARRQRASISGDAKQIFVFFKKQTGRACSCVEESGMPEGKCQICFKIGFCGGFQKYGTHDETLDYTAAFTGINVRPDYTKRPVVLQLEEGTLSGEIHWEFMPKQNLGIVDVLKTSDYRPEGTTVQYLVEVNGNVSPLTVLTLAAILTLNSKIKIIAKLKRQSLAQKSPQVSHVYLRYNLRESLTVPSDWPDFKDSRALSEYGIFNAWQVMQVLFDDTLPLLTPEDFVIFPENKTRWKLIEVQREDLVNTTIGYDTQARLIQSFEAYQQVPE